MPLEPTEQIEKFQDFFESYKQNFYDLIEKGKKAIVVDFGELSKFDPDLAEQLLNEPEDTIKAAELAIEQFDLPHFFKVRFSNLPKSQDIKIRDIRSEHLGAFITFDGLVRQASDVRPQITLAKFECPACGNTITILQIDTKFKEPTRCSCGRRGRFRLLHKELVDAQRLIVEECPESLEGGEQPKRLSVFLKEDLVEPIMEKKTTPGSKVKVIGVIKEAPIFLATGAQSTRYDLIVESNNVEPLEQTFEDIDISKKDEEKIKELSKDPKIYDKLIKSIAPSIYGHDYVKQALVLQLMGGVRKVRTDGTKTRGDMHMLLVGDPGAGKSQLLQFVSKVAPKARYLSGKGATSAGLTASVIKDDFLKGWALEAGALVLANFGVACLDELDKLSAEDSSALHEGMEQQTITISKANIQATLRSETTVLAAANPKFGRFDPHQPIASQINMPSTLINRFDLIFPIRDLPSKDVDEKIAKHVLNLQQKPTVLPTEVKIPLFKKYIAYVKQRVFPKLSDNAVDEIKKFYVSLRNSTTIGEEEVKPIPISARQLEALVRLAEGSARVRLSKVITRRDAKRAIDLLKHCLMQVGFDYETGQIDIDRISTGIPASQRGRIGVVKEIIDSLERRLGKSIPLEEIMAEASEKNIAEAQVEEIINKMKRAGDIFEPKRGFLSKI
ncbi:AAA family ATPase [archaeon]|nr:AAA family ATPase [archaeon]